MARKPLPAKKPRTSARRCRHGPTDFRYRGKWLPEPSPGTHMQPKPRARAQIRPALNILHREESNPPVDMTPSAAEQATIRRRHPRRRLLALPRLPAAAADGYFCWRSAAPMARRPHWPPIRTPRTGSVQIEYRQRNGTVNYLFAAAGQANDVSRQRSQTGNRKILDRPSPQKLISAIFSFRDLQ